MADWQLFFTKEAQDDLDKLDESLCQRIIAKVVWLNDNFDQTVHLPLGFDWKGFYKLRVGDWRVVYEFDKMKKEIFIHRIENRDKVYKK